MRGDSPSVRSSQTGPHARLREVVLRHLDAPYRRVPSDAGRRAFDGVVERLARAPFVLDAGCGTGIATAALAAAHRDTLVLGVDKSQARLATARRGHLPANALLLHCELVDFWQLAAAVGLRCERQLLLYPNPWPKPEHLRRRWHAHPVLPAMLALGGTIELRTNWGIYAEEFAEALRLAGWDAECAAFTATVPLTAFERKYSESGHRLWQCVARRPDTKTQSR